MKVSFQEGTPLRAEGAPFGFHDMRAMPISSPRYDDDETPSWMRRAAKYSFAVLAGSALLALVATMTTKASSPLGHEVEFFAEEKLSVSNRHERVTGRKLMDGLQENVVQVLAPTKLSLESGVDASWRIEAEPRSGEMLEVPSTSEAIFSHVGRYSVEATTADGKVHTFMVNAKVIRYEIRDLSNEDREIYLSAMHKYYILSQKDGEDLYGKAFKSLSYLVREHLYGAADVSCDHWHDDAGILTHHIGITWEFENNLRKIDTRTAAHYWDYTREFGEGIAWYDSPIFEDDWFGSNSPSNADHVVSTGRWAYTPILKDREHGFTKLTNPYGLLRSPWNTNPTPYLMRFNETFYSFGDDYSAFPTCGAFAQYVGSALSVVIAKLDGALHGPVHLMIGGHWGMSEKWKSLGKSMAFPDQNLLLSKWLWRQGFVRVPTTCSDDTPHADCMPSCPSAILDIFSDGAIEAEGREAEKAATEMLTKMGVFSLSPLGESYRDELHEAGLTDLDLLNELCNVGSAGEMFTSAAPQDPTFWPLHGNAERFTMYLRVLKKKGVVDMDEEWGYEHSKNLPSESGRVCDWTNVDVESPEMPTCTEAICPGHKALDLLPFTRLYDGQGNKHLTNIELYNYVSPFNEDLPYAYDSVSYWKACTDHNLLVEAGIGCGDSTDASIGC